MKQLVHQLILMQAGLHVVVCNLMSAGTVDNKINMCYDIGPIVVYMHIKIAAVVSCEPYLIM